MTTNRTNRGKIIFLAVTAAALWQREIVGQLSDGMWENSKPNNHCEPWSKLEPVVGPPGSKPRVESSSYFSRTTYNLDRLLDLGKVCEFRYEIRDRMIKIGRMALALETLGLPFDHAAIAAAVDMPQIYGEFDAKNASDDWDTATTLRNMAHVNEAIAAAYYGEQRYGLPQLKADLKSIRAAMACIEFK